MWEETRTGRWGGGCGNLEKGTKRGIRKQGCLLSSPPPSPLPYYSKETDFGCSKRTQQQTGVGKVAGWGFPLLPSQSLPPGTGHMVTSRSGPSVEVPFWASPPMHKASLATYSLERLQLATSLISSCLTIKWRQYTFFGWFWRSNRRWADSTFTLSYLPYPTWESVVVSLAPRNQSSWQRGKKKTQLEMETLCVLPAGWTAVT